MLTYIECADRRPEKSSLLSNLVNAEMVFGRLATSINYSKFAATDGESPIFGIKGRHTSRSR